MEVAYYTVNDVRTSGNNKIVTISNFNDYREIIESQLVLLMESGKVKLTNYELVNNNGRKFIRKKANEIVTDEKIFQHAMISRIGYSKYDFNVIINHLDKLKELATMEHISDSNKKYAIRVISAIRMFLSYMKDTEIKVLKKVERKALDIKYKTSWNNTLSNIKNEYMNIYTNLDLDKFNREYTYNISVYNIVLDMIETGIAIISNNSMLKLLNILKDVIENSKYNYLGEQMYTMYCRDLMEIYKDSFISGHSAIYHNLTDNERTQKANDCTAFFIKQHKKVMDKIDAEKKTIIRDIRAYGNSTASLLEDIDSVQRSIDLNILESNTTITDEKYEELLKNNFNITKDTLDKIQKAFINNTKGVKGIKALQIVNGLTADACAILDKDTNTRAQASFFLALNRRLTESTEKMMQEAIDEGLKDKLPSDVYKVIEKLKSKDEMVYQLAYYQYDKYLYRYLYKKYARKYMVKGVFRKSEWEDFCKKHMINFKDTNYKFSYLSLILDILTIDCCDVINHIDFINLKQSINFEQFTKIESYWISAYTFMLKNIKLEKLPNNRVQDIVFWTVLEDLLKVKHFYFCNTVSTEGVIQKLSNSTAFDLNTCFHLAKDSNIDIKNLLIITE